MRSRTIREGSVGLLILVGLGMFVSLVVWLTGLGLGNRSYRFIVNFTNVAGMKIGAIVRYRGVDVGRIVDVRAATNGVDATIEITPRNLLIPKDAIIEANQSGLIGETTVDIRPNRPLPENALSIDPLSGKCNSALVICHNDRIQGQIGVSFDELLRNTIRFSESYSNPEFFNNVNALTKNASIAASGAVQLTAELSLLSRSIRQEVRTFSTAANSVTAAANVTATRIGNTAEQYSLTAAQLNQLIASANEVVVTNRGTLVRTLNSISLASEQLSGLLTGLSPTVAQVNSTIGQVNTTVGQANVGELLGNLQTLSANAATASANLRDISTALNSPTNVLVLQQTLDSARATFENAQKITADLDELTGDPAFRNNLKDLIDGLSNLVSSTQQLRQQVQVARELESVSTALNTVASDSEAKPLENQALPPDIEPAETDADLNIQKQLQQLSPPAPKKPLDKSERENEQDP